MDGGKPSKAQGQQIYAAVGGTPPKAVAVWLSIGLVGREGLEPSKAQGQQIYSLPRLTTSVPAHQTY